MEIDVSQLFASDAYAPMDYSASIAEIGHDAGRVTWANAVEDADGFNFLDTPDKLDAFRDHIRGYGAWSDEEIDAWSSTECNALFLQLVSGDIREAGLNVEAPDWAQYQTASEAGRISGNMYPGDDNRVWYYLGT